jgi:hypothetical protein
MVRELTTRQSGGRLRRMLSAVWLCHCRTHCFWQTLVSGWAAWPLASCPPLLTDFCAEYERGASAAGIEGSLFDKEQSRVPLTTSELASQVARSLGEGTQELGAVGAVAVHSSSSSSQDRRGETSELTDGAAGSCWKLYCDALHHCTVAAVAATLSPIVVGPDQT